VFVGGSGDLVERIPSLARCTDTVGAGPVNRREHLRTVPMREGSLPASPPLYFLSSFL